MNTSAAERLTAMFRRAGIEAEFTTIRTRRQFTVLVRADHAERAHRELDGVAAKAGFRFLERVNYEADPDGNPEEVLFVYEVAS